MPNRFSNHTLVYHLWGWFFLFASSFSILVYGHLSLTFQIRIILMGIALPVFLGFRISLKPSQNEIPCWNQELFISTSFWIWIGLFLVLFLSRFFLIGHSSWWPAGDETLCALYVPYWLHHWHWSLFATLGQDPSTICYLSFLIFKLTHSPLLSVQLVPAAISCLTVFTAYRVACLYFSQSNGLIVFLLFLLSYWPLFTAWPFLPGITTPLWECVVLYLLYRVKQSAGKNSGILWFFLLGLSLGACPYTFFSWPVLFLWTIGVVFFIQKSNPSLKSTVVLILGTLITLSPFLWAVCQRPYGDYFWGIGGKGQLIPWLTRLKVMATYFSSLFWGEGEGTWFPSGGGYLNVLLSSCFLIGFIELFRFKHTYLFKAYAAAFILFLLPGLLSRDFEGHRILLFMPILLWTVAVGMQALLLNTHKSRRFFVLCLLLSLSLVLDLRRVNNPIVNLMHSDSRLNERQFSYDLLKPIADHYGPGLVFTEFIPNTIDYSLTCFSYSFNAAFNQTLDAEKTKWASIFTLDLYKTDLQKKFPQIKWFILPDNKHHILGIIPLTDQNRKTFLNWLPFYHFEMDLDCQFVDKPSGKSRDYLLKQMLDFYPALPKDAFIQSCFFQKLLYLYSAEKIFNPEDVWCDFDHFSKIFHGAYQNGYKNVALGEQFAQLLILEHKEDEARGLLEKIKQSQK